MSNHVNQQTLSRKTIVSRSDANVRSDLPKVKALSEDIGRRGLLQPIVVEPLNHGSDEYEVVSGNRRLAALDMLGWKDIPVVVREYKGKTGSVQRIYDNIKENEEREDVNVFDLAERAHQLVAGTYPVREGETAEPQDKKDVAANLGWTTGHLNNLIRIFNNLDPDVQKLCKKNETPVRVMLEWTGPKYQGKVTKAAVKAYVERHPKTTEERAEAILEAEDRADKQMAAFEEWLKAKEDLEKSGRKRKKKATGGGEGEGGEGGGDSSNVLAAKSKVKYLTAALAVLTDKRKEAKEAGEEEKAALFQGRIEAIRFVLGQGKLPGATENEVTSFIEAEKAAAKEAENEETEESDEE